MNFSSIDDGNATTNGSFNSTFSPIKPRKYAVYPVDDKLPQAVLTVIVLGGAIGFGYLIARLANWCYSRLAVSADDPEHIRALSKWRRLVPVSLLMFASKKKTQKEVGEAEQSTLPPSQVDPPAPPYSPELVDCDVVTEENNINNKPKIVMAMTVTTKVPSNGSIAQTESTVATLSETQAQNETETKSDMDGNLDKQKKMPSAASLISRRIVELVESDIPSSHPSGTTDLLTRRDSKVSSELGEFIVPDMNPSATQTNTPSQPEFTPQLSSHPPVTDGDPSNKEMESSPSLPSDPSNDGSSSQRGSRNVQARPLTGRSRNLNMNVSEGARPPTASKNRKSLLPQV